jgi:GDPmannose 4,6-dehydratase
MLQCDQPDDFVVASGIAHSLEEFVATAFLNVGFDWRDRVDYDSSLGALQRHHVLGWRSMVKLPR